jgi:hypothetical protein
MCTFTIPSLVKDASSMNRTDERSCGLLAHSRSNYWQKATHGGQSVSRKCWTRCTRYGCKPWSLSTLDTLMCGIPMRPETCLGSSPTASNTASSCATLRGRPTSCPRGWKAPVSRSLRSTPRTVFAHGTRYFRIASLAFP